MIKGIYNKEIRTREIEIMMTEENCVFANTIKVKLIHSNGAYVKHGDLFTICKKTGRITLCANINPDVGLQLDEDGSLIVYQNRDKINE